MSRFVDTGASAVKSAEGRRKGAAGGDGKSGAEETNVGRIVRGSLSAHKLRTTATLALIVLSIVLEVAPPLVLAQAVDALTGNTAVSLALAAGYFALIAGSGLASALREGLIVATGEGITHALRTAMMAKLRRLPAAYFTAHEAGETASLQVNDVDAIEDLFSSGIVSMFSDLGCVLGMMAVIFTKSIGLGLLLLVALPLLFAFTVHVQRKSLSANLDNRRATARASGVVPETMHIIRSLHVYRAEGFAQRRYDRAVQESFRATERTNFYDAVYSPIILTVSAAVIGAMMSLSGQGGSFQALFGMSVGTAVALISYVNSIFTPLASIGMEIQTVQSATAGWKRAQAFLDEEERTLPEAAPAKRRPERDVLQAMPGGVAAEGPAPAEGPNGPMEQVLESPVPQPSCARRGPTAPCAIEVRDVSFSYDDGTPVLERFSLAVREGEFVTLTGRTGTGKSTLFKLVLGLYDPAEGTVRVDGRDPREFQGAERRKTICCVEQRPRIVPGSVRDQVTLGNETYLDDEVWKALEVAGLGAAVTALPHGLDESYRDSLFSQGQKQLLAITRAIVSDPKILLLDEVTAGLDSATEKMVARALQKASARRTVLAITHRVPQAASGRTVEMYPPLPRR